MPKLSKPKKKRTKKTGSKSKVLQNILGLAFVALGILFLYKLPVPAQKTSQNKEPIIADQAFKKGKQESDIKRIVAPTLSIDLAVTSSKIVAGYWETSETTASHGEGSANPGERGNVVIFAHARQGLFLNLKDLKKNDSIYVLTSNKWFKYKVVNITAVYPNEINTVAPTPYEVLTLFTCSGFLDEKRLIVKAYPIRS